MTDINNLFFELIQVAIGTRICLSHTPSADEWGELYATAMKQSLVGVCFAGVQKASPQPSPEGKGEKSLLLRGDLDEAYIPEMLYLTWMGMAAKIQQRNEVVNKQCGELTEKFQKDGFDVVVLKGQSCAKRYGSLSGLRQSGDIDAWASGSREAIKKYITGNYHVGEVIYNHAHVEVFPDTEVEVHFTPSWLYSPFRNKRLQEWFMTFKVSGSTSSPTEGFKVSCGFKFQEEDGFKSPSVEFDLVYLMLHAYRHLMHEGLGLRQVMDYYFVLCTQYENENENLKKTLSSLGLMKFAGAMMYVIMTVFYGHANDNADDNFFLGIEPDEKRGKRLLAEIMRGGNMGRGDDRTGKSKTRVGYFWEHVSRQWSFMRDYPSEVLWSPFWKAWHYMMRKLGRI